MGPTFEEAKQYALMFLRWLKRIGFYGTALVTALMITGLRAGQVDGHDWVVAAIYVTVVMAVSCGLCYLAMRGAINAAAKEEVEAAVKFADESPVAPVSELFTDVYATIDENAAAQHGTHFFNKDAQFVANRRVAE